MYIGFFSTKLVLLNFVMNETETTKNSDSAHIKKREIGEYEGWDLGIQVFKNILLF
jgi:hypothetical protein